MKMFRNLLPAMLFVGLSLSILMPPFISCIIGEQSGFIGIVYSAILESIALMSTLMSERIKKRAMTNIAPLLMR